MPDVPRIRITQMEQLLTGVENEVSCKEKLLQWPSADIRLAEESVVLTASQFQADYIDILPAPWTAISISLNDMKDELLLTRYRAGQSPFILRLALTRHSSRDLDEEDFDFYAGKKEMLEIIELANFSAHDARHMNVKGAKTQWWAEREAVDKRLGELLVNIENIWLGGFRGIFAHNQGESRALSVFQKDLQSSLSRHLPSRRGKGAGKPVSFDSRILELFVGLGNPDEEGVDVDAPLEDLVYFIIDILQFNGEENAVDEVDTDSVSSDTFPLESHANSTSRLWLRWSMRLKITTLHLKLRKALINTPFLS
jgi:separase